MTKSKYFKSQINSQEENQITILERKVFYNPTRSIIFARLYAKKKGIEKMDYRKLIALRILRNKQEQF
jgi:hypothetical protein